MCINSYIFECCSHCSPFEGLAICQQSRPIPHCARTIQLTIVAALPLLLYWHLTSLCSRLLGAVPLSFRLMSATTQCTGAPLASYSLPVPGWAEEALCRYGIHAVNWKLTVETQGEEPDPAGQNS